MFKYFTCVPAQLALVITLAVSAGLRAEYLVAFPEGNYYPHYDSTRGEMKGFLPSLLNRFEQDSAITFSLRGMPIKRYQSLIATGEVDFIMPSNPAWSDTESGPLVFSGVVMISRSGFVRRSSQLGKPIELVATVTGYRLPDINPQYLFAQPKVVYTVDTFASLNMLRAGRVDAVYAHLDFVRQWVRSHHNVEAIYLDADAGFDNFSYHLATLKHTQVIRRFDQWMQQNRPTILQLMREYSVGEDMKLD
ncbi:MAG: hypothetical protein R3183_12770 [Oleiphilaceae bacterium]|nr:hypothetical protein [Oleiphilaceae bacterium]